MSRRYYLKLGILISSLLLVIAYHSNFIDNYLAPAELAATECRVIKHELGESCIPQHPQRLIVTDEVLLDAVLALGIKPIGIVESDSVGSRRSQLTKELAGIPSLGKESQPNIEQIVLLNPDLIIGFGISAEKYKLFSQIAATVSLEYVPSDWKKAFQRIGYLADKTAQASVAIAQYHQRINEFKNAMGTRLKTTEVSISRFQTARETTRFETKFSFSGVVLAEAGLAIPIKQLQLTINADQTYFRVSLERVDLLDADVLFVALDPGAKALFEKYQHSPLWQTLNVVKNKRVYPVDSSYWIFGNLLSANAILDDLFKYLLGAA